MTGEFKRMETCAPTCLKIFLSTLNFHEKPHSSKKLSCRYLGKNCQFYSSKPLMSLFVWNLRIFFFFFRVKVLYYIPTLPSLRAIFLNSKP